MQLDLNARYKRRALEVFLRLPTLRCGSAIPPLGQPSVVPRGIVNVTVGDHDLQAQLHAAEQIESHVVRCRALCPRPLCAYQPRDALDKLLLAFNALVLSSVQGVLPPIGKIVHGNSYKVLKCKIEPLVGEVRKLVVQIQAAQAEAQRPSGDA